MFKAKRNSWCYFGKCSLIPDLYSFHSSSFFSKFIYLRVVHWLVLHCLCLSWEPVEGNAFPSLVHYNTGREWTNFVSVFFMHYSPLQGCNTVHPEQSELLLFTNQRYCHSISSQFGKNYVPLILIFYPLYFNLTTCPLNFKFFSHTSSFIREPIYLPLSSSSWKSHRDWILSARMLTSFSWQF